MKKIVALLLTLLMALSLCACGEKPDQKVTAPKGDEKVSSKSLDAVYSAILPLIEDKDIMEIDAERITELYNIPTEDVKEAYIASFTIADAAFPGEVVLVEASSEDKVSEIVELLKTRLADIKAQAESYDPVSSKLADECTIEVSGTKIAYFFADNHAEMSELFFN
ncbi:MAG: DUF4358 domain-containing protein [Oscillospiraceae bacterium]|nr:DUF4358 domain-containing protein [Candidatus Limimonas coprohippi]